MGKGLHVCNPPYKKLGVHDNTYTREDYNHRPDRNSGALGDRDALVDS